MERRDVLKSASTLAAASTVGMAGCSGGLLGGGGCDTPGDTLTDSFPDSSDYEQQGDPTTGGGDEENVESTATAFYLGPDDGEFLFGITEFSSADTASSEAENVSSEDTGMEGAFGYIVADAYVYIGFGPDEDSVTSFMKASPTLSDGCVDNNLEFV